MRAPLLLVALAATTLAASAVADLKSDLQVRYGTWDAGYRRRDVAAMARLLHPGFFLVTGSGRTISRSSYLASLGKGQHGLCRYDIPHVDDPGISGAAWRADRVCARCAVLVVMLPR